LFPRNPGFHDDLTRKIRDLFPTPFDGAKVVLNKMMSSRFQLSHAVNICDAGSPTTSPVQHAAATPSAPYLFQATSVGKAAYEEMTPVFMAEVDNSGSLNGQIIRYLNQRVRCKAVVQTQCSKWLMSQGGVDYRGNSYTASLSILNPDVVSLTGVLSGNFLKRITPSLILGSDLTLFNAQGQLRSVTGLMGRYKGANWEACASVNSTGFQTGFYRDCSSTTKVGVEWECSLAQTDSNVTFGYKIDLLESANFIVKGSIDTTGTVSAIYEKRIFPLTLSLSGSINHWRGSNRFGFGISFG